MGGFTGRRSIRRCGNWIGPWPDGPIRNTRSCVVICAGRNIGSRAYHAGIRSCSHTGRWVGGVVPWREPYELRGSSTVLREARGEIPWAYSPGVDLRVGSRSASGSGRGASDSERTGRAAASAEDADCARAARIRVSHVWAADGGQREGNLMRHLRPDTCEQPWLPAHGPAHLVRFPDSARTGHANRLNSGN